MIRADGISKKFKLYRSPADRLREILVRRPCHKDFVALENISFEIGPGQSLGIVGQNGAGKSTLLKILSGIIIPDSGTISVDGKVTGLLELGTGFNAELTGMENIFLNGTLIGMNREEIDRKKQTIIDFSELGEFIHEPIKTYSSGMTMRLAFSIAIHADPRCFLVDEALAVGDAYFQQKCMRKIQEFRAGGGSMIFVSHDMNAVKTVCDSAILLDQGRMTARGKPKDVVDVYQGMLLKKMHQGEIPAEVRIKKPGTGEAAGVATGEVELVSFRLCNEGGEEISALESEEILKIIFTVKTSRDLSDPHYGIIIKNRYGVSLFETNTYCMGIKTRPVKKDQEIQVTFEMNCPLAADDYAISLGVAEKGFDRGSFEEYLLVARDIGILKVIPNNQTIFYGGVFNMHPRVTVRQG